MEPAITISLKEYNDLKDFKDTINNDGMVLQTIGYFGCKQILYSKEESIKILSELNNEYVSNNILLEKENKILVDKLSNMSTFLGWLKYKLTNHNKKMAY